MTQKMNYFSDVAIKLDPHIRHNDPIPPEKYDSLKHNLRKELGATKFSETNLFDCLNEVVETINIHQLSEKQAARLISSFLEGGLKRLFDSRVKMISLSDMIALLRYYKGDRATRHSAQEAAAAWRLDHSRIPMSLIDLETNLLMGSPEADLTSILDMAKQTVRQQLTETQRSQLASAERIYRKSHGNEQMPLKKYAEHLARILPSKKKISQISSHPQGAQPKSGKRQTNKKKQQIDQHHHEVKEMVADLTSKMETLLSQHTPQPSESQIQPVYRYNQGPQQPNYAQNNKTYPVKSSWGQPAQSYPQQPKGNHKPYHNNETQNNRPNYRPYKPGKGMDKFFRDGIPHNYENEPWDANNKHLPKKFNPREWRFLKDTDPEFKQAIKIFGHGSFRTKYQQVPNRPLFRWVAGKYIPDIPLQPFPQHLDIVVKMADGGYKLTRAILDMFEHRCSACSLYNHAAGDRTGLCPYANVTDSFELCKTCRCGFHTRCLLHPSANPLQHSRNNTVPHNSSQPQHD